MKMLVEQADPGATLAWDPQAKLRTVAVLQKVA